MNKNIGRVLRTIAIVLLGLTAAMNLMGGIGTTCAAFGFTREYRIAFADLHDFKWLYQILVVSTIILGIAGGWATYTLAKGKEKAFRNSMIILVVGTILGATQFIASMSLRGEATPANVKFMANAVTLIYFLVLKVPAIWQHIDFAAPEGNVDGATAGGLAAIVAGLLVLTVPEWAASSHTYQGTNWVLTIGRHLEVIGLFLIIAGSLLLCWTLATSLKAEWNRAAGNKNLQSVPEDRRV